MMGITPLEVRKKEFGRKMRGADPEEVKGFQEQVADEMEALLAEKAELRREASSLKEKLAGYMQLEDTIQKTLMMAQRAAEEAVSNAKKQAELILEEARGRGRDIEKEFSGLRSAKRQFAMELETMLDTFRKHLKQFGEEGNGNGEGEIEY